MRAVRWALPSFRWALLSKWTRSSPSRPDPLNPGRAGYAHRGLHCGLEVPENSLKSFAAALAIGAGIECDLRLTADDKIVLFHDADAARLCGSPLRIGAVPFRQISALRVGKEPVSTLQELLELVAGRSPMLLEVKVDRDVGRWLRPLRHALSDYSGPFGIMSFDPRIARLLKRHMPHIRRGLVIRDRLAPAARRLALWLADSQFVSIDHAALAQPWVASLRRRMPVYSWTIRTAEQRAQAAVHADSLIWEGDGGPRI